METENLTFWQELQNYFYEGDPELRTWFLVRHNVAPFVLCGLYVLVVKVLGPAYMKNRKPYNLRNVMITYNFVCVVIYLFCVSRVLYLLYFLDKRKLCEKGKLSREDGTYTMVTYGWYIYILKYVEFVDTIFFIMRKRYDLVSNLHVIHHGTLPLLAWLIMRTERSGYQGFPPIINSIVHIIMYTYYGLAAIGPKYRKYLWWKQYLTMLQMMQFVLVFMLQMVVIPLGGCEQSKFTFYLNIAGSIFFFLLFFNYYVHEYKIRRAKMEKEKQKQK